MSLRNFLKRRLPHRSQLQKQGGVRLLSEHLHEPGLWHLNRRSSAGGAATGMLCAFIPFPIQTIVSAILAIIFRVNLPLSVIFSLLSNPITIPFIFYFSYRLGAKLLALEEKNLHFTFSWEWMIETLTQTWEPLFLGCFILGSISAVITYFAILLLWRITTIMKWRNRKNNKASPD